MDSGGLILALLGPVIATQKYPLGRLFITIRTRRIIVAGKRRLFGKDTVFW